MEAEGFTTEEVTAQLQASRWSGIKSYYRHLRNLQLRGSKGLPYILIGLDNSELHKAIETRRV